MPKGSESMHGYGVRYMTDFETALKLFEDGMRMKFRMRHAKQRDSGNHSVLDKGFDGTMLDRERVLSHLIEEFEEWASSDPFVNEKEECFDLANMAFLDFWSLLDLGV